MVTNLTCDVYLIIATSRPELRAGGFLVLEWVNFQAPGLVCGRNPFSHRKGSRPPPPWYS